MTPDWQRVAQTVGHLNGHSVSVTSKRELIRKSQAEYAGEDRNKLPVYYATLEMKKAGADNISDRILIEILEKEVEK